MGAPSIPPAGSSVAYLCCLHMVGAVSAPGSLPDPMVSLSTWSLRHVLSQKCRYFTLHETEGVWVWLDTKR
ncbi:hypothetical protein F4678DRAFT_438220 [Xylaria arbuscula]|nr:hypothetical protein F4678DRAFT_438220 [Xylaria arbuscula]